MYMCRCTFNTLPQLQQKLKQYSGQKSHGLLNRMWLVRVGLQDPTVPARSLEQLCGEFHGVEVSTISATSIASSRDAFCELIKAQMGKSCRGCDWTDACRCGKCDSAIGIFSFT